MFEWDPEKYPEVIAEVPGYHDLQSEVMRVCATNIARTVLELGVGTGNTTKLILAEHPNAKIVGIDSSAKMLGAARQSLADADIDFRESRIQDPLPDGPFDQVVSVLAVHHLTAQEKADLFKRIEQVLIPDGRFILGDCVIPRNPTEAKVPYEEGYDLPSTVDEQIEWLKEAGLTAEIAWEQADLAVLVGTKPLP